MRWGEDYLYVEARENEVVFFSKNVKVFGNDSFSKKSVPYSKITSVSFSSTGGLALTYTLEVRFVGGEKPYSIGFSKFAGAAATKMQQEGEALKKYIEEKAKKAKVSKQNTSVNELIKLKEMLDMGLITTEEFNNLKARLLN